MQKTSSTPVRRTRRPASSDVIETPLQACLLPLMDPSVQFSLITGLLLATESQTVPRPLITVDVTARFRGQNMTMSYQLDGENRCRPFSGSGQLLGKPSEATVDGGNALLERFGRNHTTLHFDGDFRHGRFEAHGTLGRLETYLVLEPVLEGGLVRSLRCTGVIGDAPYLLEATLAGTQSEGELVAQGQVGDHAISKRYQVTSLGRDNTRELLWSGAGFVGDVDQRVGVTLSISA